MSDIMTPIPFSNLMNWILTEQKKNSTVFGVHKAYYAKEKLTQTIFGRKLETPIGPAAGPHTQLAQNIVAAYYAGSRFFELKTVQIMDGAELSACVNKPCILADDECYNCEWSTELYVPQAMAEYIKAWVALFVLAKEYGLGAVDGYQFNMSVGYDLAGIRSEKINHFIDTMMDAKEDATFIECKNWLMEHLDQFEHITKEDIESISPNICNSATISTLHGCPPQEIESIANYLLDEKQLHTFIKCNPTLLGYEFARNTLNEMGYDYVQFGEFHFNDDLQYEDAVPMLTRLMKKAQEKQLEFGVKITNTFPVDVTANELPSEEMYMSGKSLFPLSIALAGKLAKEFHGMLRISYSGGADYYNIDKIVQAGIWPVTVATTLLKTGGYQRLVQMAELLEPVYTKFETVDAEQTLALAEAAKTDKHHVKAIKPLPSRKLRETVPLLDCFVAPCKEGCPIHQDIPAYMELVSQGKYEEALQVIYEKNPLPFITGTICAHNCMSKCTRNFYEQPVNIRAVKLEAAKNGYKAVWDQMEVPTIQGGKKIAIVGGGPAGLSAAYFLAKAGQDVTIFEKNDSLGGVVRSVIPDFRISREAIEKDIALIQRLGVTIMTNTEVYSVQALKDQGYEAIVLAVGASKPGMLHLEKGNAINALEFLEQFKQKDGEVNLGKQVVVIGGGNTAMDTARAAKRTLGVEKVSLVYRRTKRYMPADEEELIMALEDGVEMRELLSPVSLEDGMLVCKKMVLGAADASGRRGVVETEETETIPADTVIAAVGEKVPTEFFQLNQMSVNERGKAMTDTQTLESSQPDVYVIGDGLYGPGTVVEAIRDAQKAANAIVGKQLSMDTEAAVKPEEIYAKKGILKEEAEISQEANRCLTCSNVCENCVDVCPNRANIAVKVPGMEKTQIIHVDYMCNECGNCKSFCPYASAPYQDKFTLFANEADMEASKNDGFVVLDETKVKVRFLGTITDQVPFGIQRLIDAVKNDYSYLLMKNS